MPAHLCRIRSGNHATAAPCIRSSRYRSRASANIHIEHQDEEKFSFKHDMAVGTRTSALSISEMIDLWDQEYRPS